MTMAPKTTKRRKKTKPIDPDYRAAWLACRKPWKTFVANEKPLVLWEPWSAWLPGKELDMRAMLNKVLKSGWSVQALKAYADSRWRFNKCDHVTEWSWRCAVAWTHEDLTAPLHSSASPSAFLEDFKANPLATRA